MYVKLLCIFTVYPVSTVPYFSHLSQIFFATQAETILVFISPFGLQIQLPPVNTSLTTQW